MKNLFKKVMLFAAAAMAFASCENDGLTTETILPGVDVTVNATLDEATKSHFGDYNSTDNTYPTLWSGNEDWYVAINAKYLKANCNDGEVTYGADGKSATMNMEFEGLAAATSYTLYAMSPASAFTSYAADQYYRVTVPTSQTPSATSCDAAAQLLVAQSEPQTEAVSFNVTFKHATAYANFSFKNLNLEDATVNNITVESEVPFVGKFDYQFAKEALVANAASNTVTLLTTATENLWFACAPVNVSGKKLTFTVNTNNGTFSKQVTMAENREFKAGTVATFVVDMTDAVHDAPVKYELVKNAAELFADDEIIIASSSAAFALSTTQNSNNRGAAAITKSGDYIVDPSTAVQIVTLQSGTTAGTFAFKVGSSYLCAASSSNNYLKSSTTKDANASWTISINAKGEATVQATGSYTRNLMRYNPNNGTPIFACYASGSTTGTPVAIYKIPSTKPLIVAPAVTAPIIGGEGTATYTLKNIESDDVVITSTSSHITAQKSAAGTISYTITANYGKSARTGEIVLNSPSTGATATIVVTQAAAAFSATPTTVSLKAEANSTATFTVTSTYAATIAVADATKWSVTPASIEGGTSAVTVTVTALTANETADAITGEITITRTADGEKLTVTASQAGGDAPEQTTPKFVKVTSAPSDWSGTYLIVYETGKVAFDGSRSTFDAVNNTKSVTITNNEIEATDEMKAVAFTIAKSGTNYTIKGASGKYIGNNSNSNALTTSTTALNNTLAFVSANDITIKGNGGAYLRYNASSDQKRFRYYKSSSYTGQKAIQLYKLQ